jgi:hypothetical protein
LLRSLSYRELRQWAEYYQLEPFGEWRADVRVAQLCAVIANANRDPKRRKKPFEIEDFLLFDKADRKRRRQAETGNVEPVLFDALMGLAEAADPRVRLQRAAPHLPAEKLAKLTEKAKRDGR